jgi:hypothetical protein
MKRPSWLLSSCACVLLACSGGDGTAAAGSTAGQVGAGSGAGAAGGASGTTGSGASGVGGQLTGDGGFVVPGTAGDGWTAPTSILELCDGPCQCSDGIDNDDDGTVDGFDVECVSAGDNDEGSFATAIPGDNMDPTWQDCFFDGNSGGGDDGCRYHTGCLTGDKALSDKDCELADKCIDFCKPLTPNGCDCFGCCEIRDADGKVHAVLTTATCDEDNLAGCTACVPAVDCENKCGECELCPGKTVDDLPETCQAQPPVAGSGGSTAGTTGGTAGTGTTEPPPPGYTCDGGEQVCSSTGDCSANTFCSFGCCLQIPPE